MPSPTAIAPPYLPSVAAIYTILGRFRSSFKICGMVIFHKAARIIPVSILFHAFSSYTKYPGFPVLPEEWTT